MHRDFTVSSPIESIPVENGLVLLTGYGLVVRIEQGCLILQDGVAKNKRQSKFTKATCRIKRLVLLGHTGTISLEAIRWLHDIGAAIVQIDADGQLLLSSSPFKETYPSLRRAQVIAHGKPLGLEITRHLVREKLAGQSKLLEEVLFPSKAQDIKTLQDDLASVKTLRKIRNIEAKAALIYWSGWKNVEVRFSRRDSNGIPKHWMHFVQRISPLTSSPRNAANPANALLNYLYAILEAETRIACLTIGLDPGMGFLHADQRGRDSLVLDIMEPIRPVVDRWLHEFLKGNHFQKRDFFERRDGTVRISSRVASQLAGTSALWANVVGPITEWVAVSLNRGQISTRGTKDLARWQSIATPMTQSRRSSGRNGYRKKATKKKIKISIKTCRECGTRLLDNRREFCSSKCWEKYNEELVVDEFIKAGSKSIRELRDKGESPAHGGSAAIRRGRSNAKRVFERIAWEKEHHEADIDLEKKRFQKDILPKLRDIPVRKIANFSGLSLRYVSLIRRGDYIPHPMHFSKLEELILLYNEPNGG